MLLLLEVKGRKKKKKKEKRRRERNPELPASQPSTSTQESATLHSPTSEPAQTKSGAGISILGASKVYSEAQKPINGKQLFFLMAWIISMGT